MSYADENEIVKVEVLKIGLRIDDVYDFVNTRESYPEAIPTLIDLLQNKELTNPKLLEGLVRALAVKEAKGLANKVVIEKFVQAEHEMWRWAIGNTINVIATVNDLDQIIQIVTKRKYGTARQMPTLALGKFKYPKVEETLISLLDDNDVLPHALSALGKHRSIKAKTVIESLLDHTSQLVRKEAKMALKRINKD